MVSVIVPAYNAEKTVKRCLESVLQQTYSDFEIIVINDGSSDNTESIVNEIAGKDTRVKYHYQQNQGVSQTRNNAIDLSSGEYVTFLDSDDWVEPEFMSKMVATAIKNDADFVYSNWLTETQTGISHSCVRGFDTNCNHATELLKHYILYRDGCAPWAKLYKRNIIVENKIKFNPLLPLAEDYVFILEYLSKSKSIAYDDNALLHYIYAAQGANQKVRNNYPEIEAEISRNMEDINKATGYAYEEYFCIARMRALCNSVLYMKRIKNSRKDAKQVTADIVRSLHNQIRCGKPKWNLLGKKEKIITFLSRYNLSKIVYLLFVGL